MTTTRFVDAALATHELQQEAGDGLAPEARPVVGLPAAVRAQFTAMAASLVSVDAKLTSVDGHVDGLEGFVDGIEAALTALQGYVDNLEGYTDGLETLVTATNSALTTLQGYVDALEGYTDGLETKLDTLATNQAPPSAGPKFERKTSVGTGLSTQFASQALTRGLTVYNESTSIELRIGPSSGSANYIVVRPQTYSPFFEVSNANLLFFGSASSTVDASYSGV